MRFQKEAKSFALLNHWITRRGRHLANPSSCRRPMVPAPLRRPLARPTARMAANHHRRALPDAPIDRAYTVRAGIVAHIAGAVGDLGAVADYQTAAWTAVANVQIVAIAPNRAGAGN